MKPETRRCGLPRIVVVVAEAPLESTDTGFVQAGPGWFVVNAREARWRSAEGRGAVCPFGDGAEFAQVGVNLYVLAKDEAMGMYHWESNQEDFLVLAGSGLLLVEGEERRLRKWDLVHCPPRTKHIILGTGDEPCVVLGIGAREQHDDPRMGRLPRRRTGDTTLGRSHRRDIRRKSRLRRTAAPTPGMGG